MKSFSSRKQLLLLVISVGCALLTPAAQAASHSKNPVSITDVPLPQLRTTAAGTQLWVDDKPFVMLAGELHNSSASSPAYMEPVWTRLEALHLNTVLASVSWELIEPQEGHFDFSTVDSLLAGARQHHLKLVLLWFGTWKNTFSSYTPAWVKTDLKRFARSQRPISQRSDYLTAISPFSETACQADAHAFAMLMRHLKEVDSGQRTVLMMQVENETGILGISRDHSPAAEAAFAGPVPGELTAYLKAHKASLVPELAALWQAAGGKESGTWQEVFGPGTNRDQIFSPANGADEVFMAWHIARYVNQVVAGGKREYPLPMYVNAWLVQKPGELPGQYPSGGPVSRIMDIWRAGAPAVDLFAPDIYLPNFEAICQSYTQEGNPLFIPEHGLGDEAATDALLAFGRYNAICFAPFGIDDVAATHPLRKAYSLLSPIANLVAAHQGRDEIRVIMPTGTDTQDIPFGDYRLHVKFKSQAKGAAGGLVVRLQTDEYLVAGWGFELAFEHKEGVAESVEYIAHDEGHFEDGQWVAGRRMNGDEYAIRFGDEPEWRKVKLFRYPASPPK